MYTLFVEQSQMDQPPQSPHLHAFELPPPSASVPSQKQLVVRESNARGQSVLSAFLVDSIVRALQSHAVHSLQSLKLHCPFVTVVVVPSSLLSST